MEFGASGAVPDSCCLETTPGCGTDVLRMSGQEAAAVVHTRGCVPAVLQIVHDNWVWLAVAAAVLVAVEVSAGGGRARDGNVIGREERCGCGK